MLGLQLARTTSQGAIEDLKALRGQSGMDALAAFHQALLLDYLGQTAEAGDAYNDALKTDGPSPRLVDAYGRFLERNGRVADAQALYARLPPNAGLTPVLTAAAARIAKKDKPDPFIRRPQDGVAEGLFGIAASLSDEASLDVSVLYLRLSLYLRPDLDLADVLLGDRMEMMQKFAEAIAAYRKVDRDSPYYRLAAVQIATDEARLDKTDDAIRDLKALAENSPNDIEAWIALGDAYRSANRFVDAVPAYDKAVKLLGAPQRERLAAVLYTRDRARSLAQLVRRGS